jgi:hypothetical protein
VGSESKKPVHFLVLAYQLRSGIDHARVAIDDEQVLPCN